eukprot:gene7546-1349_t
MRHLSPVVAGPALVGLVIGFGIGTQTPGFHSKGHGQLGPRLACEPVACIPGGLGDGLAQPASANGDAADPDPPVDDADTGTAAACMAACAAEGLDRSAPSPQPHPGFPIACWPLHDAPPRSELAPEFDSSGALMGSPGHCKLKMDTKMAVAFSECPDSFKWAVPCRPFGQVLWDPLATGNPSLFFASLLTIWNVLDRIVYANKPAGHSMGYIRMNQACDRAPKPPCLLPCPRQCPGTSGPPATPARPPLVTDPALQVQQYQDQCRTAMATPLAAMAVFTVKYLLSKTSRPGPLTYCETGTNGGHSSASAVVHAFDLGEYQYSDKPPLLATTGAVTGSTAIAMPTVILTAMPKVYEFLKTQFPG